LNIIIARTFTQRKKITTFGLPQKLLSHIGNFPKSKKETMAILYIPIMMIIGTNLCELGIGSISGHHYNNSKHRPLDIFVEWNGIMSFVIFMSFHVSTSYMNELLSFTS
jgi:hypothetical protein